MINFEHATVTSADEALDFLSGPGVSLIAGGTDLLPLMKDGIQQPNLLVDIKSIPELEGIVVDGQGTSIGVLTRLADIEDSEDIRRDYTALSQAAGLAASPQLRNMATIGGNVLQRPRCWYFRGDLHCWLKDGDTCYARDGQNQHHAIFQQGPCVAVHPSDLAPALIALDASLEIQATAEARTVPVEDFFKSPTEDSRIEHTLGQQEMITAVTLPPPAPGTRSAYLKAMERAAWAFALVSVAVRLTVMDGTVRDVRIVLGGVANTPYRSTAAEDHVRGKTLDGDVISAAVEAAVEGAQPLEHNSYKLTLARNLVRRALGSLA